MSDFPKWLLALAGLSLLPLLACPLYLFAFTPFGTSDSHVIRFIFYILTQLLWVSPVVLFFVSLDLYRRGYERWGITVATASALLSVGGAWLCLA